MSTQRYEQIAADLEERIRSGEFPPGAVLPSRSQLREHYDVSQSVLDKAFMILRAKKLTVTTPGVSVSVIDPLPPG